MRFAALALVLTISVGCASLKIPASAPGLPAGAELSAFGQANARMTVGPQITTYFDRDGNATHNVCTEDAGGSQCISYEVNGGEFSGWQTFLSIVTGAFTIYGAAK